MSKYLKKFDTKANYDSFKASEDFVLPNVSFIEEDNSLSYSPYIKPEPPTPTYEVIDLGLSVKWANMNIGAFSPEESGKYFAWGQTDGIEYVDATSFAGKFDSTAWYNTLPAHNLITDITPESGYDAARVNMKGNWRMPTKTELEELKDNTTRTTEMINGIQGTKFASKVEGNSNFIFVPFADYGYMGRLSSVGVGGSLRLWSSSINASDTRDAWYLSCNANRNCSVNNYSRHLGGYSVRGVCE